jgi:hypothetical protein
MLAKISVRIILVWNGRPTWDLSPAILDEIIQDGRYACSWIIANGSASFGTGKHDETT